MKDSDSTSAQFERLNLSTNPYLEKNLEFLTDCLDDLSQEQNKFQVYQKNLQRQQSQIQAHIQKKVWTNYNNKTSFIVIVFHRIFLFVAINCSS